MGLFERLRAEPVYNTRAVVQRTGVPADTFRAWERRYGLPAPRRTAGNQRLYSERDIATIAWLRDQTRAGMTISQAVALYRAEQAADPAPADAEFPRTDAEGRNGERLGKLRDEVVEALIAYDAVSADRAVEEAIALVPVEDVCLHVLQPALYEIGHRWARAEIAVSTEHFASAFVIRKLGALFNLSEPNRGRGPLVAACLEGELHEVGLLLTCLFLSRRGFRVFYLGANLPLDDLVLAVRRLRPALILLSASTPPSALRLAAATRELAGRLAESAEGAAELPPPIGFGGHVFVEQPELQSAVHGVFLGRNADEASEAVERALAAVQA